MRDLEAYLRPHVMGIVVVYGDVRVLVDGLDRALDCLLYDVDDKNMQ